MKTTPELHEAEELLVLHIDKCIAAQWGPIQLRTELIAWVEQVIDFEYRLAQTRKEARP